MRIVRGDESLRAWVEARVPDCGTLGPAECLGVVDGQDKLIAGVVFHNYRWPGIEETTAAESPRWCRKGIVRELLSYPFYQLGCTRITSLIHEQNTRSLKVTEGLGFVREGVMREAARDGGNIILLGLTKSNFEAGKYGRQST